MRITAGFPAAMPNNRNKTKGEINALHKKDKVREALSDDIYASTDLSSEDTELIAEMQRSHPKMIRPDSRMRTAIPMAPALSCVFLTFLQPGCCHLLLKNAFAFSKIHW